jgi:acyl dehydratase
VSFTNQHLYLDDLAVGQQWESQGRTITEADIVGFAGLSGDYNPIHVDHEFARTTTFKRPIAHGLLVLSISSGLCLSAPMVRVLAVLDLAEWNFRAPVHIGDTIRVQSEIVDKEVRGRGRLGVITWKRRVLNQDGKLVQEGLCRVVVEGRGKKAAGGAEAAPPADAGAPL